MTIKKIIFNSIFVSSILCFLQAHTAEMFATGMQATVSAGTAIATASPYLGVAGTAIEASHDIYTTLYPTKEAAERETLAKEKYKKIEAKSKLAQCFIKNQKTKNLNESRRPTECEEVAKLLLVLEERDELDRMTSVFTKYNQ